MEADRLVHDKATRWRAIAVVLTLGLLAPGLAGGAVSQEDLGTMGKRAQEVLSGGDYQRDLPLSLPEREGTAPGHEPREGIEEEKNWVEIDPPATRNFGGGLGQVAQVILYVGFAVVAAIVVIWLVGEYQKRSGRQVAKGPAGPSSPVGIEGALVWTPAATLAGEGRFAEALHALLLEAIETIARGLSLRPAESMTSRELIRGLRLEGEPRKGFQALVRAVEHSLFGGHAVGSAEYEQGRQDFRRATGMDAS